MEAKTFNGKKIKIRKISRKDLRNIKKFQDFINSLVEEKAKITVNEKMSFSKEKKWLEMMLKSVKSHKQAFLFAEYNEEVIGTTSIKLNVWRQSHIGMLGITIRNGYRGIGLGKYLTGEILKLAKKELKPKPKIIRLSVFSTNKPAINLYKRYGFKKVATIPKQIQHKGKLINEVIMLLDLP